MDSSSSLSKISNQYHLHIYWITAIGALGGLLFGYDTGVISGALTFITQEFHINTLTQEMIVSSVVLGALFGSIFSGCLADKFGRRSMLMLAAVAFIISTLLATLANQVYELILGRFVIGFAIGVCSYTAPLFISEMAPAQFRGFLVLVNAITITGGEALAFLMDYWLAPTHSWRWMFGLGLIPACALLLGMISLPETPRWLVSKGKIQLAQETLERIRPKEAISAELHAIEQSFSLKSARWQQLFSKKIRPVLWIGILLGIFQQFFGINTVMYYGPTIFQSLGFNSISTQMLATLGMGLVNMLLSAICMVLVDKLGRRNLLLIGSAIAGISLVIVGACMQALHVSPILQWLALVFMVTYIAGYCISVGSLFWLIIAEIFPLSVRGLGMSLATAIQWGANFIVSMTFLHMVNGLGAAHTFWLFASICFLCIGYCYLYVPETKGVPLESIEQNLEAEKPSRQLGLPV